MKDQSTLRRGKRVFVIALISISLTACETVSELTDGLPPQLTGAVACGAVGAGIGALLSDNDNAALVGGVIGGAACAIMADVAEKKRKTILAEEKALDQQIASKTAQNDQLRLKNANLRADIRQLEAQRISLSQRRSEASEDVQRLQADMQGRSLAIPDQVKIINRRIQQIDVLIDSGNVPDSQVESFRATQSNLRQRIALLRDYETQANEYLSVQV